MADALTEEPRREPAGARRAAGLRVRRPGDRRDRGAPRARHRGVQRAQPDRARPPGRAPPGGAAAHPARPRPGHPDAAAAPGRRAVRAEHRPSVARHRRARLPLVGATTVIGRGEEADVVLDDPGVSRRHAEIRVTTDGPHLTATLRDLGSTNGTFVDGERVRATDLGEHAAITIGRTRAVYRSGER
nr:FHA domain-containing protein [Angustibacter aerolatus]